jgi:hypothetical protein
MDEIQKDMTELEFIKKMCFEEGKKYAIAEFKKVLEEVKENENVWDTIYNFELK